MRNESMLDLQEPGKESEIGTLKKLQLHVF